MQASVHEETFMNTSQSASLQKPGLKPHPAQELLAGMADSHCITVEERWKEKGAWEHLQDAGRWGREREAPLL